MLKSLYANLLYCFSIATLSVSMSTLGECLKFFSEIFFLRKKSLKNFA